MDVSLATRWRPWHRRRRGDAARQPPAVFTGQPDAAHFAVPFCHNCGAALETPFCGQCGQERASRIGRRQVGADFWDEWAPFGTDFLRAAARLLRQPGTVAREFVLGARKRHINPFKLLLIGIAMLLLVLDQSNYLTSPDPAVARAMEIMQAWANGSFSLGLLAMLASTWLWFRGRGGYNLIEHLVLAAYGQFVVICVSILTKLPTLIWRDPAFLAAHIQVSRWLLELAGALVLAFACRQFFLLSWRRDGLRLTAALASFLTVKALLIKTYGWLLVWLVLKPALRAAGG